MPGVSFCPLKNGVTTQKHGWSLTHFKRVMETPSVLHCFCFPAHTGVSGKNRECETRFLYNAPNHVVCFLLYICVKRNRSLLEIHFFLGLKATEVSAPWGRTGGWLQFDSSSRKPTDGQWLRFFQHPLFSTHVRNTKMNFPPPTKKKKYIFIGVFAQQPFIVCLQKAAVLPYIFLTSSTGSGFAEPPGSRLVLHGGFWGTH